MTSEIKQERVHAYLKQNYPADTLKWVKNAEWTEEEVPLADIKMSRRPGGARELDKVKGISEAFKSGKPMEPVVLIKRVDGTHKVADGYHRTLGCQHAGKKKIKAWVGRVIQEDGPWDKEMHEKKLNVGKTAYETFEQFEKEAALLGGIARLGGKMIKSTGTELKNFGKGITGMGVRNSKKNLSNLQGSPDSTRSALSGAKKDVRKEKMNQAKSWGIAGVGAAGMGANKLVNDSIEEQVPAPATPAPTAAQFDMFNPNKK